MHGVMSNAVKSKAELARSMRGAAFTVLKHLIFSIKEYLCTPILKSESAQGVSFDSGATVV